MPGVEETLGNVISTLPQKLTVWNVLYMVVLIVVCVVVCKLILSMVTKMLRKSHLDKGLHGIIRAAVKFVLGVVTCLLVCDALGIPITSLIALFSVVGLALSLAVQGALANLAGGMVLLWAKPFQVGDFVEVDGIIGSVKEVTLLYTKINTTDNKLVYIPNKIVSEAKVLNYGAEATRRIELTFSVSYDGPIDRVKEAVLDMLRANDLALAEPQPVVGVVRYASSAIEYNLWVWCRGEDYWPAFYSVNEGLKKALDAAGLEMTYDHLNVHVIDPGQ